MTAKELEALIDKNFEPKQKQWLIDNRVKAVGTSDAEIVSNYAKTLWANKKWSGKDGAVKLAKLADMPSKIYDLEALAEAAGFSDGKDETKGERFLKAYFGGEKDKDVRDRWRTKIYDKYGDGSWAKAKKVLQGALVSKMEKDIDNNRADIMEGNADDQGVADWLISGAMGVLTPRIKGAYKEGRNWGAKEVLGDAIENAAFAAMPVGLIGKSAGKVIGKALPKVLPAISESSARGAGKILGGAGAEFVAPATVELADYGLGNTDLEPEDIIIGGATNLGVNKGLGRSAGLLLNTMGKKVSGKVPKWVKDRLEGQMSTRERADKLVSDAEDILRVANLPEKQAYEYTLRHNQNLPAKAEQQEALDILKVAQQADPVQAKLADINTRQDADMLGFEISDDQRMLNKIDENLTGLGIKHDTGLLSPESFRKAKTKAEKAKAELVQDIENKKLAEKELNERMEQLQKAREAHASKVLENLPDELTGQELANLQGLDIKPLLHKVKPRDIPVKKIETEFGLKEGTFERHPELLALFGKELKPTAGERLGEMAFQWGVNRAGTDTDASVLNQISGGRLDPKDLRKDQQRRRVEKAEAKAADILSVADYTGDDLKYLSMIKAKPDIVKVGLDDLQENTKFKNWLLLRGNDILREQNSPLVRNTFSVE